MSRWTGGITAIVVISLGCNGMARAYEDDDLLCRPGWSPDLYYQQIRQQNEQQRIRAAQYQYSLVATAAAEQRTLEMVKSARRAKLEREARRKEELIVKRKSANSMTSPTNASFIKTSQKSRSQSQ